MRPGAMKLRALTCGLWTVIVCAGCVPRVRSLIEAFPAGRAAAPWILEDKVWSGPFEAARPGIGEEAERWQRLAPQQVWLAAYRHESHPGSRVAVRVFSFVSDEAANRAYEQFLPIVVEGFQAGQRGCWTEDGVRFVWGRLVFDAFARDAANRSQPTQAVRVLSYVESKLTPELVENP